MAALLGSWVLIPQYRSGRFGRPWSQALRSHAGFGSQSLNTDQGSSDDDGSEAIKMMRSNSLNPSIQIRAVRTIVVRPARLSCWPSLNPSIQIRAVRTLRVVLYQL